MGGETGFDEILAHTSFVRGVARDLVSDPAAADDVVQETMLAAIRQRPEGGGLRGGLRGWLATVARRSALLFHRKESRLRARALRAARERYAPGAADAAARLEVQRRVVEAVLALDEPYRSAVLERYLNERSERETAGVLGVPVETVRTRLRRARDMLRSRLDQDSAGERGEWCLALLPLIGKRARPAVAGGLVMSAKLKWAAGILIAVLFSFAIVPAWRDGPSPARADRAASASNADVTPVETEPPPADDWIGIDRERDLHGVVVDEAGRPVAGAEITAVRKPAARTQTLRLSDEADVVRGPAARTDARGRFRFALPIGVQADLDVRAAGFAPMRRRSFQPGERVRLVLRRGVALTLRSEVAGVPLNVASNGRSGDAQVSREVTTDADGSATLRDLPPGIRVFVRSRSLARGNLTRFPVDLPLSGAIEVELPLAGARVLRGIVVEAGSGAPVAGALVALDWVMRGAVSTDAQGEFELVCDAPPDRWLAVWAKSAGSCLSSVVARGSEPLRIELTRGCTVTGTLVRPGGAPIEGACVHAAAASSGRRTEPSWGEARTGADGRFRIEGLDPSLLHSLIVTGDGVARSVFEFEPACDAGEEHGLGAIEIADGRLVRGVVLDASGAPVPRVGVLLKGTNADRSRLLGREIRSRPPYGAEEHRYADDLGRFAFADIADGEYLVLVGEHDAVLATAAVIVEEGAAPLTIRLPELRAFRVVVRDTSGQPLREQPANVSHGLGSATAWTDRDGIARFQVSGAVRWVELHPWRWGDAGVRYLPVEPIQGVEEDEDEVTFVLEPADEIRGTVVDESGKPVPMAVVELRPPEGKPINIATGVHGRFDAAVRKGTRWDVVVIGRQTTRPWKGHAMRHTTGSVHGVVRDVEAGRKDVRVVVRPVEPKAAFVVLRAPDGSPIAGATVHIDRKPVVTDEEGRAEFSLPPHQEFEVKVRLPEGTDFVPPPRCHWRAQDGDLVLHARTGKLREGYVELPDGRRPEGVMVLAADEQQTVGYGKTTEGGRFSIRVPLEGRVLLLTRYVDPDGVPWGGSLENDESSVLKLERMPE